MLLHIIWLDLVKKTIKKYAYKKYFVFTQEKKSL